MGAHESCLREGHVIQLKSCHSGKYLRIKEDGCVDANGGHGKFAHFKVHQHGAHFAFSSTHHPNKFLRLTGDGHIDGNGKHGGKWTEFQLVHHRDRDVSFKSVHQGSHIGVGHGGNVHHHHPSDHSTHFQIEDTN
eukprot:TRINITY_DN1305_c1_g1_i1.p1 TRINITY_DN1305_c1_g1~~TRINITY_DN1305_c1_g1_i1.p1  ORF type:complete len:150 (+),score=10.65 TRINITY_DN1305_c1_g1_i1:46-450(+)